MTLDTFRLCDEMNALTNGIILTMLSFLFYFFYATFYFGPFAVVTSRYWTSSTSIFSAIETLAMAFFSYYLDIWGFCACVYFQTSPMHQRTIISGVVVILSYQHYPFQSKSESNKIR